MNQQPLALGADLVLYRATKFLGGHADALGGVFCGPKQLVERIYHYREITGATLDPTAAYLLLRGMKTLHLRIRQQNHSALRIARHLEAHPAVVQVFYSGLETNAHYELARRQMRGFGGFLSFALYSGFEAARAFLPGCAMPTALPRLARSRPLLACLRRRAMSSQRARNAQRWAFPKA